jgi:hypothetical protein
MNTSKVKSCASFVKDYAKQERMKFLTEYDLDYPDGTMAVISVVATVFFLILLYLGA